MLGRSRTLGVRGRGSLPAAAARPSESATRRGDPAPAAHRPGAGLEGRKTPRYQRVIAHWGKDVFNMSEEELAARRALQESMDLRDQGHSDD